MNLPLINILIRVSRPELFKSRCLPSIIAQTYPFINIIRRNCKVVNDYSYNCFLNEMATRVKEGWWMVLDDDDRFTDETSLAQIVQHCDDPDRPIICQMLRNGNPKPGDLYMNRRIISKGRIGMPCLLLHVKHKNLFEFPATEDADYRWIKTVSGKLKCKFIKIPVVDAGGRSNGR